MSSNKYHTKYNLSEKVDSIYFIHCLHFFISFFSSSILFFVSLFLFVFARRGKILDIGCLGPFRRRNCFCLFFFFYDFRCDPVI